MLRTCSASLWDYAQLAFRNEDGAYVARFYA